MVAFWCQCSVRRRSSVHERESEKEGESECISYGEYGVRKKLPDLDEKTRLMENMDGTTNNPAQKVDSFVPGDVVRQGILAIRAS